MKARRPQKQAVIKAVFLMAGIVLVLDTVFVRARSNWNLGVVLPALLGVPLLVYGLFKPRLDVWFKKGAGRFVKWVFLCGYAFLAGLILIMSGMMLSTANTEPRSGAQAIIVLGAGIRGEEVSLTLQNRLDRAAAYYRENPNARIVVSGGYGRGKAVSEAQAMEKYLLSVGVPKSAVVKEDRSASTNENFRYSKELLDAIFEEGYRTVYVTNDFHILRAGINAREEGLLAEGLSAPTPVYIAPNCYAREALALLATYAFGVHISSV